MDNYIYISTETTGLEEKDERIIEIAALKIDSKTKLRTLFHQYFNPQKERRNVRLLILEKCNVGY